MILNIGTKSNTNSVFQSYECNNINNTPPTTFQWLPLSGTLFFVFFFLRSSKILSETWMQFLEWSFIESWKFSEMLENLK